MGTRGGVTACPADHGRRAAELSGIYCAMRTGIRGTNRTDVIVRHMEWLNEDMSLTRALEGKTELSFSPFSLSGIAEQRRR